ncbi:hypothetical protein BD770DRAFT_417019 [Pilaira anomala]|nr:hypothetical protein BD770DRAFT_417019 [Pilaira anomala]
MTLEPPMQLNHIKAPLSLDTNKEATFNDGNDGRAPDTTKTLLEEPKKRRKVEENPSEVLNTTILILLICSASRKNQRKGSCQSKNESDSQSDNENATAKSLMSNYSYSKVIIALCLKYSEVLLSMPGRNIWKWYL